MGMPTLDVEAVGNGSVTKTLIDEYATTFSSKKIVVSTRRRTLSHISMDIINQRIENLNKNASLNRSRNDPMAAGYGDTDAEIIEDKTSPMKPIESLGTPECVKPKPMKRKLFAPPSMFTQPDLTPTLKTDTPPNKTGKNTSKRNRDSLITPLRVQSPLHTKATKKPDEKRIKTSTKDAANNNAAAPKKTPAAKSTRRSTMFFESVERPKSKIEATAITATSSAESLTPKPVLAYTNMHQPQIDAIKEVC